MASHSKSDLTLSNNATNILLNPSRNEDSHLTHSLSMPPPTHLHLPVHIRLRLPIQRLRVAPGFKRVLRCLVRNVHFRQPIGGGGLC
jgi:hypothetical protein